MLCAFIHLSSSLVKVFSGQENQTINLANQVFDTLVFNSCKNLTLSSGYSYYLTSIVFYKSEINISFSSDVTVKRMYFHDGSFLRVGSKKLITENLFYFGSLPSDAAIGWSNSYAALCPSIAQYSAIDTTLTIVTYDNVTLTVTLSNIAAKSSTELSSNLGNPSNFYHCSFEDGTCLKIDSMKSSFTIKPMRFSEYNSISTVITMLCIESVSDFLTKGLRIYGYIGLEIKCELSLLVVNFYHSKMDLRQRMAGKVTVNGNSVTLERWEYIKSSILEFSSNVTVSANAFVQSSTNPPDSSHPAELISSFGIRFSLNSLINSYIIIGSPETVALCNINFKQGAEKIKFWGGTGFNSQLFMYMDLSSLQKSGYSGKILTSSLHLYNENPFKFMVQNVNNVKLMISAPIGQFPTNWYNLEISGVTRSLKIIHFPDAENLIICISDMQSSCDQRDIWIEPENFVDINNYIFSNTQIINLSLLAIPSPTNPTIPLNSNIGTLYFKSSNENCEITIGGTIGSFNTISLEKIVLSCTQSIQVTSLVVSGSIQIKANLLTSSISQSVSTSSLNFTGYTIEGGTFVSNVRTLEGNAIKAVSISLTGNTYVGKLSGISSSSSLTVSMNIVNPASSYTVDLFGNPSTLSFTSSVQTSIVLTHTTYSSITLVKTDATFPASISVRNVILTNSNINSITIGCSSGSFSFISSNPMVIKAFNLACTSVDIRKVTANSGTSSITASSGINLESSTISTVSTFSCGGILTLVSSIIIGSTADSSITSDISLSGSSKMQFDSRKITSQTRITISGNSEIIAGILDSPTISITGSTSKVNEMKIRTLTLLDANLNIIPKVVFLVGNNEVTSNIVKNIKIGAMSGVDELSLTRIIVDEVDDNAIILNSLKTNSVTFPSTARFKVGAIGTGKNIILQEETSPYTITWKSGDSINIVTFNTDKISVDFNNNIVHTTNIIIKAATISNGKFNINNRDNSIVESTDLKRSIYFDKIESKTKINFINVDVFCSGTFIVDAMLLMNSELKNNVHLKGYEVESSVPGYQAINGTIESGVSLVLKHISFQALGVVDLQSLELQSSFIFSEGPLISVENRVLADEASLLKAIQMPSNMEFEFVCPISFGIKGSVNSMNINTTDSWKTIALLPEQKITYNFQATKTLVLDAGTYQNMFNEVEFLHGSGINLTVQNFSYISPMLNIYSLSFESITTESGDFPFTTSHIGGNLIMSGRSNEIIRSAPLNLENVSVSFGTSYNFTKIVLQNDINFSSVQGKSPSVYTEELEFSFGKWASSIPVIINNFEISAGADISLPTSAEFDSAIIPFGSNPFPIVHYSGNIDVGHNLDDEIKESNIGNTTYCAQYFDRFIPYPEEISYNNGTAHVRSMCRKTMLVFYLPNDHTKRDVVVITVRQTIAFFVTIGVIVSGMILSFFLICKYCPHGSRNENP